MMKNVFEKYNINTPEDLLDFFIKNMKYGFTYKEKIYTDLDSDFQENMNKYYKIRLTDDFIERGYGVCWDFCELERQFFLSKNIEHKCFYLECNTIGFEGGPTHTFALYNKNNKWQWFEFSWAYERGIWEYDSIEEALLDILTKFRHFYNDNVENLELFETQEVKENLSVNDFIDHCRKGKKVKL